MNAALPAPLPTSHAGQFRPLQKVRMDGQPYWMLPTALHGLMLAPDAACVRVTLEGEGFVDQPIAVTTIGVVSLGSHLFTHAGRMRKVELLPGWGDSHASHANDASDRLGRYEDTGDSYPVCDVCGDIGLSHSKDGDPCLACLQRQEENRLN